MTRLSTYTRTQSRHLVGCLFALTVASAFADELPLTGPAYQVANEAYQAYDRGDYPTAIQNAREAIRLRPDVARLKVLLRNAQAAANKRSVRKAVKPVQPSTAPQLVSPVQAKLAEIIRLQHAGQFDDALRLADETLASDGPNDAVSAQRDLLRRQLALAAAGRAYEALSKQVWPEAATAAKAAIDYAPGVMSYRLLLIDALLRDQQNPAAEAAATAAIERDGNDITPLLMRAYAKQAQGNRAGAKDDYVLAGNRQLDAKASRNLSLIMADAALAAGEGATALDALLAIDSPDADVAERRKLAELQVVNPGDNALHTALVPPTLNCKTVADATECTARLASNPQYSLAAAAYKAMAARDYAEAVAKARALVMIAPDNGSYLQLLISALAANSEQAESRRYARAALARFTDLSDVERAYLALAADDTAAAHQAFNRADAAQQLPAKALLDAAYTAQRAEALPDASHYFREAIDANDAGSLEFAPQALFDTRRAVADLERRWGAYTSLSYRGAGGLTGVAPTNPQSDSLYWGGEVFWRPLALAGNGTYVDFYARLFDSLYSKAGYATGSASLQGAVGARWKPLTEQNLTFAFERLIRLGDASQSDWLARVGYSLGEGTDLRVDAASWWTADVNAEAGHYFEAGTRYATSEWRAGRSYRMPVIDIGSAKAVVWPHAVLGIDYSSAFATRQAIGAGVGVNVRYWFREDHYTAPRSYFDLSMHYRIKVSGDERGSGFFLRGIFYY
ncbi:NfrA family protein [Andreprevotia chitinilytica]|uniref:NfrA family protein n=1 Tax=Andreprevotia chitinilytica TaxID=396808 RepID=UPI00054DD5EA|nr:bacteriophage N4 adsorption protein A [Andreprevotia chitinilytica]